MHDRQGAPGRASASAVVPGACGSPSTAVVARNRMLNGKLQKQMQFCNGRSSRALQLCPTQDAHCPLCSESVFRPYRESLGESGRAAVVCYYYHV